MEPTQPKSKTPWGLFIGLALILSIIVSGAFYSFNKRYQPVEQSTATSTIKN